MSQAPPDHLFSLGKVVGSWGVKGQVRVHPETDFPERLPEKGRVWLWRADTGTREYRVTGGRPARGTVILSLEGVTDPDQADALRGCLVMTDEAGLEPLPAGTWYRHQLVGLAVEDESGRPLGRLAEVLATAANDVWVVRGPGGEILVPAVRQVVVAVEPEAGRIVVRLSPAEER